MNNGEEDKGLRSDRWIVDWMYDSYMQCEMQVALLLFKPDNEE